MSTNINDVRFDESAGTLAVYIRDDVASSGIVEADELSFADHGVFALDNGVRHFIPYSNVAELKQSI